MNGALREETTEPHEESNTDSTVLYVKCLGGIPARDSVRITVICFLTLRGNSRVYDSVERVERKVNHGRESEVLAHGLDGCESTRECHAGCSGNGHGDPRTQPAGRDHVHAEQRTKNPHDRGDGPIAVRDVGARFADCNAVGREVKREEDSVKRVAVKEELDKGLILSWAPISRVIHTYAMPIRTHSKARQAMSRGPEEKSAEVLRAFSRSDLVCWTSCCGTWMK